MSFGMAPRLDETYLGALVSLPGAYLTSVAENTLCLRCELVTRILMACTISIKNDAAIQTNKVEIPLR